MNKRQIKWWKRHRNAELAVLMQDKELQELLNAEVKGNTAYKKK